MPQIVNPEIRTRWFVRFAHTHAHGFGELKFETSERVDSIKATLQGVASQGIFVPTASDGKTHILNMRNVLNIELEEYRVE